MMWGENYMKKLTCLVTFVLLLIVASTTSYADGSYIIKDYAVDVVVNLDNSYHIIEKILVDHIDEGHGIVRNVQKKGTTSYLIDGTWVDKKYSHAVENIDVYGVKFKASNNGDYKSIKIGDKTEYVSGEVEYIISYDYIIGDDKIAEFDQFYFNLIGTEWDCMIENAEFHIKMPSNIKDYYINFTAGMYGDEGNDMVSYLVDGDTITATLNEPLYQYEGVTVRVEMPEGYYTEVVRKFNLWDYFYPIALCVLLLISFSLYLKFGKDTKPIPIVSFSPPKGLTSAEVGYILDGVVDDKDVISLILFWASRGYLKIEVSEDDNITLIKQNELGKKKSSYQRDMFKELFKGGNTVDISKLNNFGDVVESTKIDLTNHFEYNTQNSIYTSSSKTVSNLLKVLSILPIFSCVLKLGIDNPLNIGLNFVILGGFLYSVGFSFIVFRISNIFNKWNTLLRKERNRNLVLWVTIMVLVSLIFIVLMILFFGNITLSLLAILSLFFMAYLSTMSKRKTEQGEKLVNETLGFRQFINLAEKDRLNELAEENPLYFYDILPYAYVLGISDKWCKKFEDINIAPSKWMIFGNDSYAWDALYYQRLLRQSMNTVETTMSKRSKPVHSRGSSSGGNSIGGSGYTGGGAGGGGGTTW